MSLRIAIIGAGMAGVSAGRLLADRGHRVALLEESRGYGVADHPVFPQG